MGQKSSYTKEHFVTQLPLNKEAKRSVNYPPNIGMVTFVRTNEPMQGVIKRESIIKGLQIVILRHLPAVDLRPLPGKTNGKLKLTPEAVLLAIHGPALANWAIQASRRFQRPRLAKGPGGRPPRYAGSSILLLAVVQTLWHKPYESVIDLVATRSSLAETLGFAERTISQGQYWERRRQLGVLPFLFFFLGLVGQLVRLGVITGKSLIVDSSLLSARRSTTTRAAKANARSPCPSSSNNGNVW